MAQTRIGIDLGTYNSAVALADDRGAAHMLSSREGQGFQGRYVFPSFIKYDRSGKRVLKRGEEAARDLMTDPEQVVWGVKSLLGRGISELPQGRFQYRAVERDGVMGVAIGESLLTPEEVAAEILSWIRADVQDPAVNPQFAGRRVDEAIIAHPARYRSNQIKATRKAAEQAGFSNIRLVTEPEAAARAYELELDSSVTQRLMAIDWGAGTLDIVICRLKPGLDGKPRIQTVNPAHGDIDLGGNDIDDALLERVIESEGLHQLEEALESFRRGDADGVPAALRRSFGDLRRTVERLKIELSARPVSRDWTVYGDESRTITGFRSSCAGPSDEASFVLEDVLGLREATVGWTGRGEPRTILERVRAHVEFGFEESGYDPTDIDYLILVGGPMHMPCVRQLLSHIFARNNRVLAQLREIEEKEFRVDPMYAVAKGAALLDLTVSGPVHQPPMDYGIYYYPDINAEASGQRVGRIVVRRGSGIPGSGEFSGIQVSGHEAGQAQKVGIYLREDVPDRSEDEKYIAQEEYGFVPVYAQGMQSTIDTQISFDAEGIASLRVRDQSGISMQLRDVASSSYGTEISKPEREPPENDPIKVLVDVLGITEGEARTLVQRIRTGNLEMAATGLGQAMNTSTEEARYIVDSLVDSPEPRLVTGSKVQGLKQIVQVLLQYSTASTSQHIASLRQRLSGNMQQLPDSGAHQNIYAETYAAAQELANMLRSEGLITQDQFSDYGHRLQGLEELDLSQILD